MKEAIILDIATTYERLKVLARTVNTGHDAVRALGDKVRAVAMDAIKEAILIGHALNEAKALQPHGEFEGWVRNACPGIGKRQSQNYRRLASWAADAKHGAHLRDCQSLRHAFEMAGIFQPTARGKPATRAGSERANMRLPTISFPRKPVVQWTHQERQDFNKWFDEQFDPAYERGCEIRKSLNTIDVDIEVVPSGDSDAPPPSPARKSITISQSAG
jgi:hypothetical protein